MSAGEPIPSNDPAREEQIEQVVEACRRIGEAFLALLEGGVFNSIGVSVETQRELEKLGDPALDARLQRILQWTAEVEAASRKYLGLDKTS